MRLWDIYTEDTIRRVSCQVKIGRGLGKKRVTFRVQELRTQSESSFVYWVRPTDSSQITFVWFISVSPSCSSHFILGLRLLLPLGEMRIRTSSFSFVLNGLGSPLLSTSPDELSSTPGNISLSRLDVSSSSLLFGSGVRGRCTVVETTRNYRLELTSGHWFLLVRYVPS